MCLRIDPLPPKESKIGKQFSPGAGPSPKHNPHASKNGLLKPTQKYRSKQVSAQHHQGSPSQQIKDSRPTSVAQGVVTPCVAEPSGDDGLIGVAVPSKEAMFLVTPGPGLEVSAQQSVEVPSSLDPGKHVVMILQQSRKALEESTPHATVVLGQGGIGKENRKPTETQKKEALHGGKLHSTIRRTMKTKQKIQGTSRTKDTLEMLKEELGGPIESMLVPSRSTGEIAHACESLVRKIQRLLDQEWRVRITHVYIEGNKCADFLATYALDMGGGFHLLDVPPEGLTNLLREDADGVGHARLYPR
ncbi:hypothetical protein K1719_041570 [Acacia pycnantha]|nr:hypothetical protein K1719_041570 [Acacia pycnantha]